MLFTIRCNQVNIERSTIIGLQDMKVISKLNIIINSILCKIVVVEAQEHAVNMIERGLYDQLSTTVSL